MKTFFLLPILIFSFLFTTAQQNHFIYLQTENKQPFYIKLDNKILNSSPSGYLIISKLNEGTYKLILGFPKNEWPEQELNCKVEKKDVGYILKNAGDKGWSLYNLQSGVTTATGDVVQKTEAVSTPKQDDAFSLMLANVVNDSTILQKDVVIDEPKEKIKNEKPGKDIKEIKTADVPAADINAKSIITRKMKMNSKEGLNLVYTDETGNTIDTIRIIIPTDQNEKKKDAINIADVSIPQNKINTSTLISENKKNEVLQPVTNNNDVVQTVNERKHESTSKRKSKKIIQQTQPEEKKFIDFDSTKKENNTAEQKPAMINSDCKSTASEEDFFKLRKKMAAENTSENMIKVAKKTFKNKCFTTEYIKNLSALFLTDDGRYLFFDAAYPYVSDSDAFPILEKQLIDQYYVNRFRAMIHH